MKTIKVKILTHWLERGRTRRILRGASLDFTEDRGFFRAHFEAKMTPDQYDALVDFWSRTPGVHIAETVVQ